MLAHCAAAGSLCCCCGGRRLWQSCVASCTKRIFRSISAAKAGVKELKSELTRAASARRLQRVSTIIFVDEIHRWSKAQQDALLQDCEQGTITLIGATTENPSFSLNNAILSRCRLVVFSKLSSTALTQVVKRALDTNPTLKGISISESALIAMVSAADGDARVSLNLLELPSTSTAVDGEITKAVVMAAAQKRSLYDRNGDYHYDLISALRRLMRFASEDIGLAEPAALQQAVATDQAVHAVRLGCPKPV